MSLHNLMQVFFKNTALFFIAFLTLKKKTQKYAK